VPGVRHALLHAYQVGFTSTLNHLLIISTVVAFAGSVAAFALVRQRDFVINQAFGPPGAAPTGGPRSGATAPAPAAAAPAG
jgi:hypothetical protein